jgi:hypothetical protein
MVSPDEGWIVGGGGDLQDGRAATAFILHYSGGRWTRYGSLMQNTELNQVQMLSPTDGWIVGIGNLQFATQHISLILHYDGKRWTQVQAPSVQDITGLDMLSATDGWATGLSTVLHYDGQRWTVFQQILQISELSMGSASDGWAVAGDPSNERNTLLWHYNGSQWVQSVTFTSSSPAMTTGVFSLSMDSATDGWAVGGDFYNDPTQNKEFFLHYTQGRWTQVPMPHGITVYGVKMISADDGWATGTDTPGGTLLLLRYQRGSWRIYQS